MGDMIDDLIDIIETCPTMTPIQSMIKVIGVGGGGCNAVNYMFREKVEGWCRNSWRFLQEKPSSLCRFP